MRTQRRAALLLAALLPLAMVHRTSALATGASDAAAQREDLDRFEQDFFEVDRSYGVTQRAEARKRLKELRASLGEISDAKFVLTLSQITALADNGHTGVLYRGNGSELKRVGVRLISFGGEFFVVQAMAEHEHLLGGRLVSIDGSSVAKLRAVARTLTGGIASRRDQMAPAFLESPGQLHALGCARQANQAGYVFEMRDGSSKRATLSAVTTPGGGRDATLTLLSPESAPPGWRSLLSDEKTPWSLKEIGETMRRTDLKEANAIVIQLRANVDGMKPIAAFLNESSAERSRAGRRHVILDMRMNGGGDLQLTQKWMSALPKSLPPGGRVAVLTSPGTFSAAISSTGYVKQAGGASVVLIGEAPGDRLNFFAEGQPIFLPHTGAVVLPATQRHDYVSGCRPFSDCHGYMVTHPISVPNLEPEVKAPWTMEACIAGRDPGMEAAVKVLASSR